MSILANNSDSVRADSGSQTNETEPERSWQQEMKAAIRDLDTLCKRLELPEDLRIGAEATSVFPVFVPQPFLKRMKLGDVDDPLLRQVIPFAAEDQSPEHYSIDPLQESDATLKPGLLQKYKGRVLMVSTGACAVHCRYCFRRHFPYEQSPNNLAQWQPAIDQIAADETIEEVILSGGDPLTIVDARLAELVDAFNSIGHIKRLRIHTRLPIMIPQRVTDGLLQMLGNSRLHVIVVIHANHANELDGFVDDSIRKLIEVGATMLNQSVLLRGVNDDIEAMVELSNRLLDLRVMPYYLHQLDPVVGVSHFEVPKERGIELIAEMRARLPGYAVPRFVKELAGEPNKTVWA